MFQQFDLCAYVERAMGIECIILWVVQTSEGEGLPFQLFVTMLIKPMALKISLKRPDWSHWTFLFGYFRIMRNLSGGEAFDSFEMIL